MSVKIPSKYRDLLEKPVVVAFGTVTEDGEPNVSPVWVSVEGDTVLVNSAVGRKKDRNIQQNPNVVVTAIDPSNPYRYLEIRGVVEERTTEGGVEHIDQLAKKYTGRDSYYGGFNSEEQRNKETRVIYRIKPTNVIGQG